LLGDVPELSQAESAQLDQVFEFSEEHLDLLALTP